MSDDRLERDIDESDLIDYALNAMSDEQRLQIETRLEDDPVGQKTVDKLTDLVYGLKQFEKDTKPSARIRKSIERHLDELQKPSPADTQNDRRLWPRDPLSRIALVLAILILPLPAVLLICSVAMNLHEHARRAQAVNEMKLVGIAMHNYHDTYMQIPLSDFDQFRVPNGSNSLEYFSGELLPNKLGSYGVLIDELKRERDARNMAMSSLKASCRVKVLGDGNVALVTGEGRKTITKDGLAKVTWAIDSNGDGALETVTVSGLAISDDGKSLVNDGKDVNVRLWNGQTMLMVTPRIIITDEDEEVLVLEGLGDALARASSESYERIVENPFVPVSGQSALSTFSIDVDTASYSNVRRFLISGRLPPADAVRIEELVNYFPYDYPQPQSGEPFSVTMEVAECPWQVKHKLVRIGVKGREIPRDKRPASNLVFLIDVSGSMSDDNKLPLLKESMKLLVGQLDERDRVTIVTYAGDAGLKLAPTTGDKQIEIRRIIDSLRPGGSTHGSAGIQLAYQKAIESFIDEGVNRVILATDGDLNVGITDDDSLIDLIKEKAQSSVFLTVLGFGTGNYQDSKLEKLADHGNGMCAYIDNLREGRKVLVEQIAGSLVTIAKDVKIQVEFNPAQVAGYRLIGYENRVMAAKDFDNDKKDAGEIGAGHTVTALYEIVPVGLADSNNGETSEDKITHLKELLRDEKTNRDDLLENFGPEHPEVVEIQKRIENFEKMVSEQLRPLKYQQVIKQDASFSTTPAAKSGDLLTLWLRFKKPDEDKSERIDFTLKNGKTRFNRASKDFQFAASVASFGMLLRDSKHAGSATFASVEEIATGAIGKDLNGYRKEFVDLVRQAESLKR